jgi:hypothetical protein
LGLYGHVVLIKGRRMVAVSYFLDVEGERNQKKKFFGLFSLSSLLMMMQELFISID